jgi:hypothetical protein
MATSGPDGRVRSAVRDRNGRAATCLQGGARRPSTVAQRFAYSSADRDSNPTDDPRVVAGLDDVRLARADLDLGAVLVLDGQATGVDHADVAKLATVGSGDGLDTVRPAPPGLEREAPPSLGSRASRSAASRTRSG